MTKNAFPQNSQTRSVRRIIVCEINCEQPAASLIPENTEPCALYFFSSFPVHGHYVDFGMIEMSFLPRPCCLRSIDTMVAGTVSF